MKVLYQLLACLTLGSVIGKKNATHSKSKCKTCGANITKAKMSKLKCVKFDEALKGKKNPP